MNVAQEMDIMTLRDLLAVHKDRIAFSDGEKVFELDNTIISYRENTLLIKIKDVAKHEPRL